jgi:hypothetical protein
MLMMIKSSKLLNQLMPGHSSMKRWEKKVSTPMLEMLAVSFLEAKSRESPSLELS